MRSSISISIVLSCSALCLSLLLLSRKAKACGPDFSGYYFTWLLEHYTYNNKLYPFQFESESRFYDRSWQYDQEAIPENDPTKYNTALWRAYLQLPATIPDSNIKNSIYNNTPEALNNLATKKTAENEIEKKILQKQNADVIVSYLLLLQKYATVMMPPNDVWDYSSYTNVKGKEEVNAFVGECEQQISNVKDPFLQWRLLYLMLRATHFNKYHQQAVALYEKYNGRLVKDNSLPQFWCEGMHAGALLRTGKQDKAIYYSARAFANCPDQYMAAMNTYLFSNRKWKSALPYCTDARDSMYVALLEGANNPFPNMEHIEFIYALNPVAEELKLLWLRETNKIEQYILNRSKYGANQYYFDSEDPVNMDSVYTVSKTLNRFLDFAGKVMDDRRDLPLKVTVGNTVAYYYYRVKNYKSASHYLCRISTLTKNDIEKVQYDLLYQLTNLRLTNQFDGDHFISLIKYFKSQKNSMNLHAGYYLLYNEIGPYYLQQKDTATAFWVYTLANGYYSETFNIYSSDYSPEGWNSVNYATYLLNHRFDREQVNALKQEFISRKGKTPFATYLITETQISKGIKMFDLVNARKYMLTGDWENALEMFETLPEDFKAQTGPNPANFRINDTLEDTKYEMKRQTYSVKQILELAQKLKLNADKPGPRTAKDKLLYANVLYNLSYYGKNHFILDNHWNHAGYRTTPYYLYDSVDAHLYLSGEDIYQLPMHPRYRDYFYLFTAEKYLTQALTVLSSDEEKAQCVFLLAKCWQKRCPLLYKQSEYGYREILSDYVANSMKNPWFKTLAKTYANTSLQKQVFASCSYYKMYLNK